MHRDSVHREAHARIRAADFPGILQYDDPFVRLELLDKATYDTIKKQVNPPVRPELRVVSDVDQIEKMLRGRVFWMEIRRDEYGVAARIGKVVFADGSVKSFEDWYASLVSYYPDLDMLVLGGETPGDVSSFDLTRGGDPAGGGPEDIFYSPSELYRFVGGANIDEAGYLPRYMERRTSLGGYRLVGRRDEDSWDNLYADPWAMLDDQGTCRVDGFWDGEHIFYVEYAIYPFDHSFWKGWSAHGPEHWGAMKRNYDRRFRITLKEL